MTDSNTIKDPAQEQEDTRTQEEKCRDGEHSEQVVLSLKCPSCSEQLYEKIIKKPFKTATMAILLAYGGSNFIDYAISDNRYPLKVEQAIMEACISSYKEPISYNTYRNKKSICLNALQDTMNEISYIRYKVHKKSFLTAFKDNADNYIRARN